MIAASAPRPISQSDTSELSLRPAEEAEQRWQIAYDAGLESHDLSTSAQHLPRP